MMKRGLTALFLISQTVSALAEDAPETRPATAEEIAGAQCDDRRSSIRVLSVDPSLEKPFEVLSCEYENVKFYDCDDLNSFLYDIPEFFLLGGMDVIDEGPVRGAHDHLGPVYDKHCTTALG